VRSHANWFSVVLAFFKTVGLFAGGLYLLGFGLFPFAHHDFWLPFEQFGCSILGFCFLAWFGVSYYRFWRLLRSGQA